MEWIDKPVGAVIDYFAATASSFMTWAIQLGTLIGIIAIGWSCIKLALGTLEPAKAIIGTITKFLMFIAVLNFYPGACLAVQKIATQMGRQAAPGVEAKLAQQLALLAQRLDEEISGKIQNYEKEIDLKNQSISNRNVIIEEMGSGIVDDGAFGSAAMGIASDAKAKNKAQKNIDKANKSGDARILASLLTVLHPVDEDGNPTSASLADRYLLTDLYLPGTAFLSPNTMLKIGVLVGNVIWEKEFTDADGNTYKPNDSESPKLSPFGGISMYRIFNYIMLFLLRLIIIIAMVFAILQYVMCVIEFTIVVSVSIICVPCMLMDELKDIAQKVLPSILAQAMKLVLITISMYFCMWIFMDFAAQVIYESTAFNLSTFAYVLFSIFLAFAITQSAPKIAVAIMTGQPQLSMGELVGAMGTAAALGGMAAGSTMQGLSVAKAAAPPVARAGIDALGGMNAVMKAGTTTAGLARGEGRSGAAGFMSGAMGEMGHRMGQGLKSKLTNIGHAGLQGKGGGASAEGAGKNRFDFDSDINSESLSYGYAKNQDGMAKTAGEHISDQGTLAALRAEKNYAQKQMKGGSNNFSSTLST